MQRQSVVSSNVVSVGWEQDTLEVEFRGKNGANSVYQYAGVPFLLFQELLSAASVGSYLAARIKPHYPPKKIS